eukprot:jgi/Psemu1/283241/fgenesh1_pg.22_\
MTGLSALFYLLFPAAVMALVPHQFWNGRKTTAATTRTKNFSPQQRRIPIGTSSISMYFDDCERSNEIEERLKKSLFDSNNISPCEKDNGNNENDNPWIISPSDEKRQALEKFLGYNPKSASRLTDEQIEEETLRWVVNTDIVCTGDDDGDGDGDGDDESSPDIIDRQRITAVQYDSINDLVVASSCDSMAHSLAFLWDRIAEVIEAEMSSATANASLPPNSAKLIVFPNSQTLWSYDTMVTMLEAIQISRPLLPSNLELGLDLFHPNFKNSPRMWSPQWHSPFPTVGITIKTKKQTTVDDDIADLDSIRGKLDVLFQAVDATREDVFQTSDQDDLQILEECRSWWNEENDGTDSDPSRADCDDPNTDWIVQSTGSPFQLYNTLWNSVFDLSTGGKSSFVVIDPFLDYYTLHRVAVTVNAALLRLDIPVRITEVYHPFSRSRSGNSSSKTRPPHGMIQLVPTKHKS